MSLAKLRDFTLKGQVSGSGCRVLGSMCQVPGGRRSEALKNWSLTRDTWHLLGFVGVGGVFPRFLASVEDAVDHRHIG